MSNDWSILQHDAAFIATVIEKFTTLVNDADFLEKYVINYKFLQHTYDVCVKSNEQVIFSCGKDRFCPDSCTTWHLLKIPSIAKDACLEFFHGEVSPIYDKVVELYEKQEEERKRIKQVSDAQEKINTRKHALAKIDSLIAR